MVAVAPIQSLALELPYATEAAVKREKKKSSFFSLPERLMSLVPQTIYVKKMLRLIVMIPHSFIAF